MSRHRHAVGISAKSHCGAASAAAAPAAAQARVQLASASPAASLPASASVAPLVMRTSVSGSTVSPAYRCECSATAWRRTGTPAEGGHAHAGGARPLELADGSQRLSWLPDPLFCGRAGRRTCSALECRPTSHGWVLLRLLEERGGQRILHAARSLQLIIREAVQNGGG